MEETIGEALRRERLAAGMTQRELASILEVAAPFLNRIELRGESLPTPRLMRVPFRAVLLTYAQRYREIAAELERMAGELP